MPNHGRGRIRAAALHARHNQELGAPYRPLSHTDYPRQPFRQMASVGVLVFRKARNWGKREIPWSIDQGVGNVDGEGLLTGGYAPVEKGREAEADNVEPRWRLS